MCKKQQQQNEWNQSTECEPEICFNCCCLVCIFFSLNYHTEDNLHQVSMISGISITSYFLRTSKQENNNPINIDLNVTVFEIIAGVRLCACAHVSNALHTIASNWLDPTMESKLPAVRHYYSKLWSVWTVVSYNYEALIQC